MRLIARTVAPLIGGLLALVVAGYLSTTLSWVLMLVALVLLFDGATAMWARAGRTGNLTTHRQ